MGGAASVIVRMEEETDTPGVRVRWVLESPGEPPLYITKLWPSVSTVSVPVLQVWLEVGATLVMGRFGTRGASLL